LFGRCNLSGARRRWRDKLAATQRFLLLTAVVAGVAAATDYPFGEWRRASEAPIISPQGTTWESTGAGQVPNVVFVEGMVRQGKRWLFYYGGADKYVGVAEVHVQ
jgi:hypothetical protein